MPASRLTEVIRRRGVARLLLPALAGRIPDSITATAIVVLVRSATGSYPAAGLAAAAYGLGTGVCAPMAGRALDRLGQRRVLPALAAAYTASLALLALTAGHLGTGGAVLLAAAAGTARPPLEAALRAMWPQLVPAGRLDAAYALDSTVQELIWIGGPLLFALLLAVGSPRLPLLACGLLSLAGTVAYVTSPRHALSPRHAPRPRQVTSPQHAAGRRPAAAGTHGPLRSAALRALLAVAALYGVASGTLTVSLVGFADGHGGVAWAGVLVAIWGAGSLAGGVLYGSRPWRAPVELRAIGCLGLFGAALLLLAAAPGLVILALLMIALGLPLAPWLGSLSASVQRAVSPTAVTEAFAWTFAVITVGQAAGSAVAGPVIQTAGTSGAFLLGGAAALAGAALGALGRSKFRRPYRSAV